VEWHYGVEAHYPEGAASTARFASGLGRSGDYKKV
jgi:enoyl-CoA hydratase